MDRAPERLVTAIQEGDDDDNPETAGDANWQPFINTPNYPEYSSGANNVTGAATRTLELFFGTDHMTFSATTTNPAAPQQVRTYSRFSDAATDVVNVRVYQGLHFRFADVEARKQGRHVAQWCSRTSCDRRVMTKARMTTASERFARVTSESRDGSFARNGRFLDCVEVGSCKRKQEKLLQLPRPT